MPCSKSFFGQACSFTGTLDFSVILFLCLWISTHSQRKEELGQYSQSSWPHTLSITSVTVCFRTLFLVFDRGLNVSIMKHIIEGSIKKLIHAKTFSLNLHENSKIHKKQKLLSSEIQTRLASSAPRLKTSNNYIVPLDVFNVNSNTQADGKNTLQKVCRSLWSMLREILIHYFVRLKASEISRLVWGEKKNKWSQRVCPLTFNFWLRVLSPSG